MKIMRLLRYFGSVQSPEPGKTTIRFVMDGKERIVRTVEFDVDKNTWTIDLQRE